jgi:hemin uptake protein HemP
MVLLVNIDFKNSIILQSENKTVRTRTLTKGTDIRQASTSEVVSLRGEEIGVPVFHISELVGAGRQALIRHEGQTYHLRVTSNRKLILTK